MEKTLYTFLVFLWAFTTVEAQDYQFKVLASKGRAQVMHGEDQDAQPLKIGEELHVDDHVITVEEDYLGLMHKTGKTIEISERGVYPVTDLEKRVPPVITNIVIRLSAFIDNKLDEFDDEAEFDYKKKLKATAGTQRATTGVIKLLVKNEKGVNQVMGNQMLLRWVSTEQSSNYEVGISSAFGDELAKFQTDEAFIEIDLDVPPLDKERYVIVQVKSLDQGFESQKYQIQKVQNGGDEEDVTMMLQEFNDESSAHALMLGMFFEERGLYLDALTHYERAVRLSPDVVFFEKMRDQLIQVNSLGQ